MKTGTFIESRHFLAAMYLRLSRDDNVIKGRRVALCSSNAKDVPNGDNKPESNSIGNQRELIRTFIHGQQDIELYDIYVDDGFSGSNFARVR